MPFARLRQVHGATWCTSSTSPPRPARGRRRSADALVTAAPGLGLMVRVADCVPVLLADADAGVVGGGPRRTRRHRARRGRRAVEQMRGRGRRARSAAWVGPHVCGRCYEVPGRDARRGRGRRARDLPRRPGARPRSTSAPASRAQLAARGVAVVDVGGCTLEDARPALPPPRRRRAGPARPGWCGCHEHAPTTSRGGSWPPSLAEVRARIAAACAAPGRARRGGHAGRGHQVLPGLRRARARRPRRHRRGGEPPPGGRRPRPRSAPTSALRWHYIGGLQSNKAAAVDGVRRRRALGGPAQARRPARPRGAPSAGAPLDVLLQVSLDRPGAGTRSGADPDGLAALADAGRRRRAAAPARPDGRGAARRGARGGVRPAGRAARRLLADHPGATCCRPG